MATATITKKMVTMNSMVLSTITEEIFIFLLEELTISKREYEVLKAMASENSNKEIADSLFISESTVKTHVSNILIKLGSKRRTQAIRKAKEYGILG